MNAYGRKKTKKKCYSSKDVGHSRAQFFISTDVAIDCWVTESVRQY